MERGEGDNFQTFIFQRVCLVSGARSVHERILSRIDLLNKGAYEELVQYCYGAAESLLGENVEAKPRSNVIVIFQTLFCVVNCEKLFGLFASKIRVGFC